MVGSRFLLLSFSLTLILQFNINNAQDFLYGFCFNNHTANSPFKANLNSLLSSIPNSISPNNSHFYNNTVGNNLDRVSAVFQCRGDLTYEDCKKCAELSTTNIKTECPYSKEITIWYDYCLLRYSNTIIISTLLEEPKHYVSYPSSINDTDLFRSTQKDLMETLADVAVNSTNMFATGLQNVTATQTIYGLVQCTQDITRRDCNRCLSESIVQIPACCDAKDGGKILKPSCILMFEVFDFFQSGLMRPVRNFSPDIGKTDKKLSGFIVIVVAVLLTLVVTLTIVNIFFCVRRNKGIQIQKDEEGEIPTVESLQFNFATISTATDSFSVCNKLGEGGFGAVYKGTLLDGREIAVKRLSKHSDQGVDEFKNEVLLLAKLQHRNLVRLLGFCLEESEKLLIYEYVLNSSLDQFIFDTIKRTVLDWETRYKIIVGIARGLLYLHEDSHDRIIHRDLKASNILLDAEMNPKISDFGLARLFVIDQTQGNTSKIVGTYGYMSPEYLHHGQFSVKSDVFSFGVLVLEIISGQKNNSFYQTRDEDLLSYVWRQWDQGVALELLEPTLKGHYSENEVERCLQMGLLCVQEDHAKRPTMATVVMMLNSYSITLPSPSPPAFFVNSGRHSDMTTATNKTNMNASDVPLLDKSVTSSVNDTSISVSIPR